MEPKEGQPSVGIPSTRIAESLGRAIVQNIVMLGFVAAVTDIAPRDAMRDAVRDSVPRGTEELNLRAFDAGWEFYQREYGGGGGGVENQEEDTAVAAGVAE